jgi:hypothetical protein
MIKRLLLVLAIVLIATPSFAATITAADCEDHSVASAIAAASEGDTVIIPPGTCTWADQMTITKGITIKGSSKTQTIIKHGLASSTYNTALIKFLGMTSTMTPVVSDIGFVVDTSSTVPFMGGLIIISGASNTNYTSTFRIHDCDFTTSRQVNGSHFINIYGAYGLIDNNTFSLTTASNYTLQSITVYGFSMAGNDLGAAAWGRAIEYNSANAVYIENNTFTYSFLSDGAYDAAAGARIVFRYNNVIGTNIGTHGRASGGHYGTLFNEIYNNNFSSSFTIYRGTTIGSGTGVVYNNMYDSHYTATINFINMRTCADCASTGCLTGCNKWSCGSVAGDGTTYATITSYPDSPTYITDLNCTEAGVLSSTHGWGRCNGTNKLDGNSDATGWPCASQVGTSGSNYTTSAPMYLWSNYKVDTLSNGTLASDGCSSPALTDHIKDQRDYYDNGTTAKSGYVAYTCPHPATGLAEGCATTGATMYGTTGYNTGADTNAPTVTSVYVNGATMTINFSEAITSLADAGFSLTPSGAAVTVDCPAVSTAASSMACTISRALVQSETAKYAYTDTKVVDAATNPLANIGATDITGNLTPAEAPTSKLTVNKTGSGCSVTSSPSGILASGATASDDFDFNTNTVVTLSGYSENGWNAITYGGDCASNGTVTMSAAKECTATCTQVYLFP